MTARDRRSLPRVTAVAVSALLLAGSSLAGQEPPADSGGARTRVEGGVRMSRLRAERVTFLGGTAAFDLGGRFFFGGAGWVLREPLEVSVAEGATGLRLELAYGGALAGWTFARREGARAEARVLAGAGTARLRLRAAGAEIAADNFLAVEPAVAASVPLVGSLGLWAELAWRWVRGVEDLPGVGADQIRGPSVSLGVALGPF
jgi:hypothetical protein